MARRLTAKTSESSWPMLPPAASLTLALAQAQVNCHHAVLVANADQRNIAVDVDLHLDHLLGRLRQVRDVGESDLIRNLLLHSKARIGIVLGAAGLGIDLDAAHSENPLQPAAHRR